MRRTDAVLAAVLILAGCNLGDLANGSFRGPPLARFGGELLAGPAMANARPDHLALVWLNCNLRRTDAGWATTQEVPFTGTFPFAYTFDVYETPPDAALQTNDDGTGRIGLATLIAYQDVNGNGLLDTIPAGKGPIDAVLGSSAVDFYWKPGQQFYEIWFVEGKVPSNHPDLKPGFNIVTADGVVPLSTPIPIEINPTATQNLFLCQAFSSPDGPYQKNVNACLGPGGLRAFGSMYRLSPVLDGAPRAAGAVMEVYSGAGEHPDATVTVNGVALTYQPENHVFFAWDDTGAMVKPDALNTLRVHVDGMDDLVLDLRVDGDLTVTSPADGQTFRRTETIPVSWSASTGSEYYRVTQTSTMESGNYRRYNTDATNISLLPLPGLVNTAGQVNGMISVVSPHEYFDANGTDVVAFSRSFVRYSYLP